MYVETPGTLIWTRVKEMDLDTYFEKMYKFIQQSLF
jgi:hypothetical protein